MRILNGYYRPSFRLSERSCRTFAWANVGILDEIVPQYPTGLLGALAGRASPMQRKRNGRAHLRRAWRSVSPFRDPVY